VAEGVLDKLYVGEKVIWALILNVIHSARSRDAFMITSGKSVKVKLRNSQ